MILCVEWRDPWLPANIALDAVLLRRFVPTGDLWSICCLDAEPFAVKIARADSEFSMFERCCSGTRLPHSGELGIGLVSA